jgi:hypothetical protein
MMRNDVAMSSDMLGYSPTDLLPLDADNPSGVGSPTHLIPTSHRCCAQLTKIHVVAPSYHPLLPLIKKALFIAAIENHFPFLLSPFSVTIFISK